MSTEPDEIIERIMREPLDEACWRERTEYDRLTHGRAGVVLHGSGNLGRKVAIGLRAEGIEPLAFTDMDPSSWGSEREGIRVFAPEDAARQWGDTATFVMCTFSPGADRTHSRLAKALAERGIAFAVSFVPLFWKYAERFLPHYRIDLPSKVVAASSDILNAYSKIAELRSRVEFARQLAWLTAPTFSELAEESPECEFYFPPDLIRLSDDEVFLDCGAFDGDTVASFLAASGGRFGKVHAFEPDPTNFTKLSNAVHALGPEVAQRIALHRQAIGSESGTVRFDPSGTLTASVIEDGDAGMAVDVVRLDDVVSDKPTYIKMDLEGYEPYALAGARRMISTHAPKIAASAYHRQSHLWSLLLQIDSYRAGYNYFFRRYGDQFGDVVCYALPAA